MIECVQDMYSRIKINFFVIIPSFDCGVEKVMQFMIKNVHNFNENVIYIYGICAPHVLDMWYIKTSNHCIYNSLYY